MADYEIRQVWPDEADAVAALVNRAFKVESYFKRGDRTTPDGVTAMMRDGLFLALALDHGGELVGSVFVRPSRPQGYFGMLAIDPQRQGQGLGRRLIDAAERHLAHAGCTHAEIHVVNLREELPPYYARLGYVTVGEVPFPKPDELSQPCHLIVMRKPLTSPS